MSLRAGPLSDEKVIALMNSSFIPVLASYTSEETFGFVSGEQEREIQRIWRESLEKKLGYGMVHVYLLEPATGQVFDSLGVVKASVTNNLLDLLGRAVDRYKVKPGKPVLKTKRLVFPSQLPPESLLLHLTSRDLGCKRETPAEPRPRDRMCGGWLDYASENSIVLEKAEWKKLTPPAGEKSWTIPAEVASKFLIYFYPQMEANVVSNHRVNDGALRAAVVSSDSKIVRIKLEGQLKLKRVQEPEAIFVDAPLLGYLDYDPAARRIKTLRLITENGTCGTRHFGVALRSVGAEELPKSKD